MIPLKLASPLVITKTESGVKFLEKMAGIRFASRIFCSSSTIKKYLTEYGIERRRPHLTHGRPSQPRYGKRLVRGNEVEHLTKQSVIKIVQNLREQGMSLRQICRFLSQIGVPKKKRGVRWHPEMVKRILQASAASHSKPRIHDQPLVSQTSG